MFTIDQIKAAHSKVKSGADFPAYIRDLKQLGVTAYDTFVTDGHTDYFGSNNYQTASPGKYGPLTIADTSNKEEFIRLLKLHQQGGSDYLTFCQHCAETGVHKWIVRIDAMTCTYYDKNGEELLVEQVPA